MKIHTTLLVTAAGVMVGAALLAAKAELDKQTGYSGAAPVTNDVKDNNSTRKTASVKDASPTKTQPEDVRFSAGISEIVKMVRSDTDSSVIQAYIEHSPIAFYPSAEEIIYLHQLGTPAPIVSAIIRHGGELRARAAKAYKENQNRGTQSGSPTIVAPAATYSGATQSPSTAVVYNGYPDYSYYYRAYPYWSYPVYSYSYWSPFYYGYCYPRYYGYSRYGYGYYGRGYQAYAYHHGFHGGSYRGGSPAHGHPGGRVAHRGR